MLLSVETDVSMEEGKAFDFRVTISLILIIFYTLTFVISSGAASPSIIHH